MPTGDRHDVLALSVHGPAGVLDLHVPAGASGADVAAEYSRQASLPTVPRLYTRMGRPLADGLSLAESGIGPGSVLVAADAPEPRRRSRARRTAAAGSRRAAPGTALRRVVRRRGPRRDAGRGVRRLAAGVDRARRDDRGPRGRGRPRLPALGALGRAPGARGPGLRRGRGRRDRLGPCPRATPHGDRDRRARRGDLCRGGPRARRAGRGGPAGADDRRRLAVHRDHRRGPRRGRGAGGLGGPAARRDAGCAVRAADRGRRARPVPPGPRTPRGHRVVGARATRRADAGASSYHASS